MADSTHRPVKVFHRGSRSSAPENSLAGIDHAIARGADWIEVDVRMTRDGTFVLFHDRSLRRMLGMRGTVSGRDWHEIAGNGLVHGGVRTGEHVPLALDGIDRITTRSTALLEFKGRFDDKRLDAFVRIVSSRCEPGRVVFATRSPRLLDQFSTAVRPHRVGAFIAPLMLHAIARPERLLADVVLVHWMACPAGVVRRFQRAGKFVVLTEIGFRDISRKATISGADGYFVTA